MNPDSHHRVPRQPSFLKRDQVTGVVIGPSSAAFAPHPGEDGLSVYRDNRLRADGYGARHVAEAGRVASLAVGFTDAVVLDQALRVTQDPQPEPAGIGPAHALIQGWEQLSRAKVREAARALAGSASCTHPDCEWARISWPG